MNSTDATALIVGLGIGIPVFVTAILFVVFRAVQKAIARQRAELEREGIERDSGLLWITARFTNFRGPGFYAGRSVGKARGRLVLTRERLVVLTGAGPRRYGAFSRADLGQFVVSTAEDGALHIHSDSPPGATGSLDYRVPVSDPVNWVTALTAAGAKSR
jgi:hypothetical protein